MLQLNSPYTVDGWEDVCVPANATAKKITRAEWTTDVQQSWTRVKHLLEECVTLAQRCEKYTVRGFTDTSVLHWGAMVTQFPDADLRSCVHPSGMPPAPLVFV